jgi:hypothetical protein
MLAVGALENFPLEKKPVGFQFGKKKHKRRRTKEQLVLLPKSPISLLNNSSQYQPQGQYCAIFTSHPPAFSNVVELTAKGPK